MSSIPNSPLRILLIGCGGIVTAHLPAFEKYPDKLRLVAACDPSESARRMRAEQMAQFGRVKTFADHHEAIQDMGGQIDAALVTTPHYLHFPQARACVEAGIPVLIEKPACNNLAEAQELYALARQRNGMVMIGQTRRYNRWARQLREWVASKPENFGELASFSIEAWQNILCWISTKPDKSADFWILDKERAGGGVVVSLGCHLLDLIRYVAGADYEEVSAYGVFNPPFKNGAESACTATLKMENGAVGTLNANYLAKRVPYSETFKMFGTRGSIVQHSGQWGRYEGEVRIGSTVDDNPPGWDFQYQGLEPMPQVEIPGYGDGLFVNQLMEFHAAITTGREPLTSLRDNLNTMAVIDAIYQSMNHNGQPVKVKALQ